jgi:hypothetical protein
MTNSTGVKQFESDYYPQGSQRVITATKDSLLKFQAKQLDTESGLENAARLYSPATARFLSVAAKPAIKTPHPQALNKVSAPAAKPLNALTSSVGSILGAFRSALSSYRQCAQTAMDIGGSDFLSGFGDAGSFVELLCGQPDFSNIATTPCFGLLSSGIFQGTICGYEVSCQDLSAGFFFQGKQTCLKCFFRPCPLAISFFSLEGTTEFNEFTVLGLHGHPWDFCRCDRFK